jgi:hypothetical protein
MRKPFSIAFTTIPEASGACSRTSGGPPRVIADETEPSAANCAAARIANWEVTVHLRLLSLSLAICSSLGRSHRSRFLSGYCSRCTSGLMEEATQRLPAPQSGGGVVRAAIGIGRLFLGFAVGCAESHPIAWNLAAIKPSGLRASSIHETGRQRHPALRRSMPR